MHVILASGSSYRADLLARLGISFERVATQVDESALPGERPEQLVQRLARAKAQAVSTTGAAVVIGSDQVAVIDAPGHAVHGQVLGKPGTAAAARAQLTLLSGQRARFLTGLCVRVLPAERLLTLVEPFVVTFRRLEPEQIAQYVALDAPLDCAGSFRAEGLGITLFERLAGDDPSALIGLPLIQLVTLLRRVGVDVLSPVPAAPP